jgi:glycosyltransferase involved in cell wall biosynthesis
LPTVIENGKSGFLSCDPDELIDHMQFLLANPQAAREMGEQARNVARERFSLERFAQDWNRAFAQVLDQRLVSA